MNAIAKFEASEARSAPTPTVDEAEAQSAKVRLLVVDDDSALCDLMKSYFEHFGFEVTAAHTAAEGNSQVERGRYDLAILDWKLDDGASGLELSTLSKALHPEIPVIIFTGADDDEELLRKAVADRADALIRKTGSLAVLSTEVLRQFARSRRN